MMTIEQVVYFVQAAAGGPIKIGIASDVRERFLGLQNMCPVPLVCLATMPGYADEEAVLHRQFAAARLHGEWFQPTSQLLALIESVRHNSEEVASQYHNRQTGEHTPAWRLFLRSRQSIRAYESSLLERLSSVEIQLERAKVELRQASEAARKAERELRQLKREIDVRWQAANTRHCPQCSEQMASEDEKCWQCDYCVRCDAELPSRKHRLCAACRSDSGGLERYSRHLVRSVVDLTWGVRDREVQRLAEQARKAVHPQSRARVVRGVRLAVLCAERLRETGTVPLTGTESTDA